MGSVINFGNTEMTDDKNIRHLIGDKCSSEVWRQGKSDRKECRILWVLVVYSHRNQSEQNKLFLERGPWLSIINFLKFRHLLCHWQAVPNITVCFKKNDPISNNYI